MENKRIPFDWDKYQSGWYEAITENGKKPDQIFHNPNAKEHARLVYWIDGDIVHRCSNGTNKELKHYYDLFLTPKPKFKKGINLYSDGSIIDFPSETIAKDMSKVIETDSRKYIKTILIEWEA